MDVCVVVWLFKIWASVRSVTVRSVRLWSREARVESCSGIHTYLLILHLPLFIAEGLLMVHRPAGSLNAYILHTACKDDVGKSALHVLR
jgi:hypothetical protein